jgi:hypothetical protein
MKVDLIDSMGSDLTVVNAAWAAGVIDGEGSFVSYQDKRSSHIFNRIQVEMTDLDTLLKLKEILGGTISNPIKQPGLKTRWRWCLNKKVDVFNALLRIGPFLSNRRKEQAGKLFSNLEPKVCT